jgi:hypothetical protein
METPTPRRINLVGAIFRLIVFFCADTFCIRWRTGDRACMAAKGYTRFFNVNSAQFKEMHRRAVRPAYFNCVAPLLKCVVRNWLLIPSTIGTWIRRFFRPLVGFMKLDPLKRSSPYAYLMESCRILL